jgi:UDP-N-acetyl-2-amino-2-deoxyglucuronate dehydrogenase
MTLKEKLQSQISNTKKDIQLTYITSRGPWYLVSWKGQVERSGGLTTNIGIHFFDLLIWLFGEVQYSEVHISYPTKTGGFLELKNARVRWLLSIDKADLPEETRNKNKTTFRSITIDGEELEFSEGFTDLHTTVYKEVLAGRGFTLDDARPSVTLAHQIRNAIPTGLNANSQPWLRKLK